MKKIFRDRIIQLGAEENASEFARKCGLKQQDISRYLNHGALPVSDKLAQIATCFNVTTDWLLGLTPTSPTPPSPPLTHVIQSFLQDRHARHLRPTTLSLYRQITNRLLTHLGTDSPLSACTPAALSTYLHPLIPSSRNSHIRHLNALFNYAHHLHAHPNPLTHHPKARLPHPPRGILTVEQTRQLLQAAQQHAPRLIPYLALGLFAGIRPAELTRLHPEQIGKEWITIHGTVAKTADHRTIPIRPNLRAWLDTYPPTYPIRALSQKHHYAAIRRLCAPNNIPWPRNCI